MRFMHWLIAFVTAAVMCSAANAGEKPAWKPVQITWHGQSFFEIKSSKGTVVVTDPHAIDAFGRITGVKADVITMSHLHSDHTQVGVVENFRDPRVEKIQGLINRGGFRPTWNLIEKKIKDVKITTAGTYHDASKGMDRGLNTVFIFEVDGWRIVHLGDLGHTLTKAQIKKIGRPDVLMIPVGGIYTINGAEAKEVMKQLKPKYYVFPMHRGTPGYDVVLTADEFLDGQPDEQVVRLDKSENKNANTIELSRDPRRPSPLIVMMSARGKK